MKPLLTFLTLFLMLGGVASAKINWEERNLCKKSDYKNLCSKIIDKKLVGLNTKVNFKFDKGKITALIPVQNNENISLLREPDSSYVATYTGKHLVYEDAGGVHITAFAYTDGYMTHFICDKSNKCTDTKTLK
jgi:hypothetical protein